jgi:hypothetical protein
MLPAGSAPLTYAGHTRCGQVALPRHPVLGLPRADQRGAHRRRRLGAGRLRRGRQPDVRHLRDRLQPHPGSDQHSSAGGLLRTQSRALSARPSTRTRVMGRIHGAMLTVAADRGAGSRRQLGCGHSPGRSSARWSRSHPSSPSPIRAAAVDSRGGHDGRGSHRIVTPNQPRDPVRDSSATSSERPGHGRWFRVILSRAATRDRGGDATGMVVRGGPGGQTQRRASLRADHRG